MRKTYLRIFRIALSASLLISAATALAQPTYDACPTPQNLVSSATPTVFVATLKGATATLATMTPAGSCNANPISADEWFNFTALTAYPTIKLSAVAASLTASGYMVQLYAATPCLGGTMLACGSSSSATYNLATTAVNGGAGLTVGAVYYIRVGKNDNTLATGGNSANWNFSIAVDDPDPATILVSRSYINVTKGKTGGVVDPGDTLEMRSTFVITGLTADSLSFADTLFQGRGLRLVPGSITTRTNEGLIYRNTNAGAMNPFTDDSTDVDGGWWHRPAGTDTIIRINFGANSSRYTRGTLAYNSRPTIFGSRCIMLATYRVVVYAPYNTKLNYKTGSMTVRDKATGILTKNTIKSDSLIVYQSVGLCPNAVSVSNAVGAEFNGTFGAPSSAPPLARNRGTSTNIYGYTYKPFNSAGSGPDDYAYAIANNTFSTTYTTTGNWPKPDVVAPLHRLFNHWDISGDHTGAADPLRGNAPCDTTLPVSAGNPCGYMLTINSAFKTDTAFSYDVSGLCPNTYYEISAWFKNMCAKCGGDSTGKGNAAVGYVASSLNDSSGVKPNIAFDVNGIDYYTTGDITYTGTERAGADTMNRWKKRGFVYLTGPSQTTFKLTLRNNAPGGGGNDWALDDIAVGTCLPNMQYSPSLNPTVCQGNSLTINDTIRSYFNNYRYHQWQKSTNSGSTWTNVSTVRDSTPVYKSSLGLYEYITSYTIPNTSTAQVDSGTLYRVIVATASANVSSPSCQVTDGFSIINLRVMNCTPTLNVELLSFNGSLKSQYATLNWITSQEDEPLHFQLERSEDGLNFVTAATLPGYEHYTDTKNIYSFRDPRLVTGVTYYRLALVAADGSKKYSRTIQLDHSANRAIELSSLVNPFNGSVDYTLISPANAQVEVVLSDLFGKAVKKSTRMIYAGSNALTLTETSHLPAGTYILTIHTPDGVITRKLMKSNQ